MRENFLKNKWQILVINVLVILTFILGYGHFGDVIFDSFREVYIPKQMIDGHVLYKDVFNIYSPLSYLLNAFLIKIFSPNLSVFYIIGLLLTLGIINILYLISNKFLSKNYTLGVLFSFFCISILSPNVFNFFLPYSYGMLYGLLFILLCIYFLVNKKFTLAYLFYSLAVCSKYEFILLLPVLIYMSWKFKHWKHVFAFFIPYFLTIFILLIQGVESNDIVASVQIVRIMSFSKTLYWFYSVSGLIFRPELLLVYIENIIKFIVPTLLLFFIKKIYIYPIVLVYCFLYATPEIFIYFLPLILILACIRFKKLTSNEKVFLLSVLFISIKVFFALTLKSYGVYFIPLALIAILIVLPQKIHRALIISIISFAFALGVQNVKTLLAKNIKLHSNSEIVFTSKYNALPINELIDYINNNTQKNDKVVIYPECLSVNVLTNRSSDNKFYSMIPLYVETFGDYTVIDRLKRVKPEYIVISNYNTSVYYYFYFGYDYANEIVQFVTENYDKQAEIGEDLKFIVYKLKND